MQTRSSPSQKISYNEFLNLPVFKIIAIIQIAPLSHSKTSAPRYQSKQVKFLNIYSSSIHELVDCDSPLEVVNMYQRSGRLSKILGFSKESFNDCTS